MAKDDYYVIAYQILAYLYTSLKGGKDIDEKYLKKDSPYFGPINEKYWKYILENLYRDEYIRGFSLSYFDNDLYVSELEKMEITPKGIDYLVDSSLMEKAKRFLKGAKEIAPFA